MNNDLATVMVRKPGTDMIRTFATRLARRCLLEKLCPVDHPIMIAELALVEMARSKLQEHIMITYDHEDYPCVVTQLQQMIREIAEKKIRGQVEEEAMSRQIIQAIRDENLDYLLPIVN